MMNFGNCSFKVVIDDHVVAFVGKAQLEFRLSDAAFNVLHRVGATLDEALA